MKADKSLRREQQLHKRRTGMKVIGKSVFTLKDIILKRSGEKVDDPKR